MIMLISTAVAFSQSDGRTNLTNPDNQSSQSVPTEPIRQKPPPVLIRQALDTASAALATIPADPLFHSDPLGGILQPLDRATHSLERSEKLQFGATYTFLNQYATVAPDGVRHNQLSGRFDFTGAWSAYDHGSTAGSVFLLVRSGTNIGISQQYNLSDRLGSGLYLNCLQGGGPQEPITLNILYWRQDFFSKRLSFYVGKIHPNQFVSLSMYDNDERTQFLNGSNDGDLAVASDGTYAGGGAVEIQATRHLYIHALAVDTEGAQQRNIETLVDKKYMEAIEFGWFSGLPGSRYQDYRGGFWREDTNNLGSGYGGAFGFEHEFTNGWAPFGKLGFATETGTAIKQVFSIGLAQTHPFGRRGDMFGTAFNYSEPSHSGKHHESVVESFYRLRLTRGVDIGPDMEISIHPTYATKSYTTTLLSTRMRIIF